MLSALLNVPSSKQDWDIWSYNHRISHDAIRDAIQKQKNVSLIDYQLDPISQDYLQDWLERNQQTHIEMDSAIGAQSSDLTDVDPKQQNQLVAWIWDHYQEHQTAEAALGIGS